MTEVLQHMLNTHKFSLCLMPKFLVLEEPFQQHLWLFTELITLLCEMFCHFDFDRPVYFLVLK